MRDDDPFHRALKTYRSVFVSTAIFSIAINALMFVGPLYMMQVYDRVLLSRNETTLLMLTLIAVAMLAICGVVEWIRARVLVRAGLRFDQMIAEGLFTRVVAKTLLQPQARSEVVLSDLDRLREFMTGSGLIAIFDVAWIPVFLFVCFVFHPLIGWIAASGALVIFALALINEFMTKKPLAEAAGHGQAAQHFSNSALQNIEVIRALGMDSNMRDRWANLHRQMIEKQASASDLAGWLLSMSKFVRMALQIFILGGGAFLVLEAAISPGAMIAASIMMGRALAPVDQVVGQWKQVVGARTAYTRLGLMFRESPEEAERTALPRPEGRLSVEQLVIAVPGSQKPLLQGITFAVEPGEAIAVVGPSGAGKSSLVRSLVGVWPPVSGAVRLDGAELQNWDRDDLGTHLGYLPQSVELFAGTIAENIARFRENASSHDIVEAAKTARVHQMILNLPNGYDTQVGTGGRQLSGGQRQRVGLARALFGDPAVVILDEPNSSLDSEGEEALTEAIVELKKNKKAVIAVTHKMSLVAVTDKSLVLADGKLVAFGSSRDFFAPKPAPTPVGAGQTRNIA